MSTHKKVLTEREKQVMNCVIEGDTNKEISKKLGIAVSAVEKYVVKAQLVLSARNRAHAAVLCYIGYKKLQISDSSGYAASMKQLTANTKYHENIKFV